MRRSDIPFHTRLLKLECFLLSLSKQSFVSHSLSLSPPQNSDRTKVPEERWAHSSKRKSHQHKLGSLPLLSVCACAEEGEKGNKRRNKKLLGFEGEKNKEAPDPFLI
jgi:hypothetical protein